MSLRCDYCKKEISSPKGINVTYVCSCCGKSFCLKRDGTIKTIKRPFPYIVLAMLALVIFIVNALIVDGYHFISIFSFWVMSLLMVLLAIKHKIIFYHPTVYLNYSDNGFSDRFITVFCFLLYLGPTITIPVMVVIKLMEL